MDKVKVKVCGLRRREDIDYANCIKPDLIGFVFAPSKRRVTPEQAEQLVQGLDSSIAVAGVFVDQPIAFIVDLLERGIIQYVQLHGDEDAAYIASLRETCGKKGIAAKLIKAVKVREAKDLAHVEEWDCEYLLLDAWQEEGEMAGGNGRSFDWNLVQAIGKPFFLAGGLTPTNVAQAIRMTKPFGVDASSCMETDGFKDFDKMKTFVEGARCTECGKDKKKEKTDE
ncbi:MAG: phosphoribosylanthranilate isomerase [Lachnospiraceae bacterium]|nr:phosphoribosylanthranilate isomerase [Lachnospiraceae bacterium]